MELKIIRLQETTHEKDAFLHIIMLYISNHWTWLCYL